MATEPKKSRKGQPRVAKDKNVYVVSPSELAGVTIVNTPEEALEVVLANPGHKVLKHTIPAKRRPASNQVPA